MEPLDPEDTELIRKARTIFNGRVVATFPKPKDPIEQQKINRKIYEYCKKNNLH